MSVNVRCLVTKMYNCVEPACGRLDIVATMAFGVCELVRACVSVCACVRASGLSRPYHNFRMQWMIFKLLIKNVHHYETMCRV